MAHTSNRPNIPEFVEVGRRSDWPGLIVLRITMENGQAQWIGLTPDQAEKNGRALLEEAAIARSTPC